MSEDKKKQLKLNVTFRSTAFEEDLYYYALKQGKKEIGGFSGYVKKLIIADRVKNN